MLPGLRAAALAVAPLIYFPLVQYPAYANEVQIVVRPEGEAAGLAALVRDAVGRRHPQVATSAMTMSEMIGGTVARPRLRAWLAATFAALALLLAAAGVYGTISLLVRERVGEMALRLALGARPSDVARLVGRRAAWLAAIGVAGGLAGSVWLSQLITHLLFDVAPLDLPTFAIATGALVATVLAAVAGPALRAARVDPGEALR